MAAGSDTQQLHGGRLVARGLRAAGVSKLFTLSGGHIFSIYDGCRAEGIDIVDVRHEQTAAFAAEGWAKVTRSLGACALTAGPGVTNGMSAIASARENHSPVLALGGRAPAFRWGQGSLQEMDHVPFMAPLTKLAATAAATAEIPQLLDAAMQTAMTPHYGPVFLDFPMDHVFMESDAPEVTTGLPQAWTGPAADGVEAAAALLRDARRPVIMAGSGLYWGRGEEALRALAERLRIPVFLNGLGRGCVPADHDLAFSRVRSAGLGGADVALVIGVPLDFRLAFGAAFDAGAQIIALDAAPPERPSPREVAAQLTGALPATLTALAEAAGAPAGSVLSAREEWVGRLRSQETEKREAEREELADPRAPLHPLRIYGELAGMLDRDAIIVGDGGDFVSYAGRVVDSYAPGCWLDPGPFGCLGAGPGQALAAKLAHPDRQVVLLLGDGAFGFAGMEFDTLARHGVSVVGIIGNNGIWALEKYPMEFLYGYSVAAELAPERRYDQVAEALGCHGELVRSPDELRPALERAFAAGGPALVNVLTDPSVAYPRRSNLA
ncbi:MAG TPA: acetolactate synthase [Solirubrobacteraceae bacterium]|nr:acetolactate synthase [Solirubrobacteraceae bacterium]